MTRTFGAAVAVLAATWLWPLPSLGLPPFALHMTRHVALVAVAAPLLALALAGGRLDVGRTRLDAITASLLELVVVWAWHAPALHALAQRSAAATVVEQGSFLLCGVALWGAALGGSPERRRSRAVGGVVGLLFTSMHMTLLGALLALTPRALFAVHAHHGGAATDQHLGGAVMLLVGGAAYLAGGLWLLRDALEGRR